RPGKQVAGCRLRVAGPPPATRHPPPRVGAPVRKTTGRAHSHRLSGRIAAAETPVARNRAARKAGKWCRSVRPHRDCPICLERWLIEGRDALDFAVYLLRAVDQYEAARVTSNVAPA